MAIYAIGDPHLSHMDPKPMDVFGPAWRDHPRPLWARWQAEVRPEDIVLVPGDISWAMRLEEALPDLHDLDSLPGQKVLIQGNHDYWWQSISRLRRLGLATMHFVQNDHIAMGGITICGSRGWLSPGGGSWHDDPEQNQRIYQRELIRLQLSLQSARQAGATDIIVMLHYPPLSDPGQPSGFREILEGTPGVRDCVYGHLHGLPAGAAFEGEHGGVRYRLVACDYVDFTPVLIRP